MDNNYRPNQKNSIFDKLFASFFILFPLVYSSEVVDPVLISRQIYLSFFVFIIAVIIAIKIRKKELTSNFSFLKLYLPLLLAFFLLISLISVFQAVAYTETLFATSKIGVEFIFFILTTFLIIQKELHPPFLFKAIIFFAFISVCIAFYQVIRIYSNHSVDYYRSEIIQQRITNYIIYMVKSSYANKNLFSSILFLSIPFIINSKPFSKGWKLFAYTLISIIILSIIFLKSKIVILALLFFFTINICFALISKKTISRFLYLALFTFFTTIVFLIYKFPFYFLTLFDGTSTKIRIALWNNTIQLIKENFWLGVGLGNWKIISQKFGIDKLDIYRIGSNLANDAVKFYQRPHNDFLWVFSESGIFGFLVYSSIFIFAIYYLAKLIKEAKSLTERNFYLVFFAGLIGYILIAQVGFPMERIEHQVFLFLIFSILTANYFTVFSPKKEKTKFILSTFSFILLIGLPLLFSFVVAIKRYSGEKHTRKMYHFHQTSNWSQLILEADKSTNFFYSLDPTAAPISWYKGVAQFALGKLKEATLSFEKAYLINPYHVHVINNLASAYEKNKEHKKAEDLYLKALSISPTFEEARLNLSAVYYNSKDYEKAFIIIDGCNIHSKDPKYKLFLPFILRSWVENVFLKKQGSSYEMKTNILSSNEKLVELYFDSKKNNSKFTLNLYLNL